MKLEMTQFDWSPVSFTGEGGKIITGSKARVATAFHDYVGYWVEVSVWAKNATLMAMRQMTIEDDCVLDLDSDQFIAAPVYVWKQGTVRVPIADLEADFDGIVRGFLEAVAAHYKFDDSKFVFDEKDWEEAFAKDAYDYFRPYYSVD